MAVDRPARKRPALAATTRPAPATPAAAPSRAIPLSVTVEGGAYALILAIAAAMRLSALDRWPLSLAESQHALAAWLALANRPYDLTGLSTFLVYPTTIPFALFGDSDATARLVPALVGTMLVAMPWLLRGSLGRAGALVAALLLALSPSFLLFSRTLDGGILLAAASLGLFAFWSAHRGDLRAGVLRLRFLAVPLIALVVLAATGLLTNLSGLQRGLLDPPIAWLTGLVSSTAALPWHYYLTCLAVYEPLVVIFAAVAVVWLPAGSRLAAGHDDSPSTGGQPGQLWLPAHLVVLVAWSLLGLTWLTISPEKPPSAILVPLLPLTLLAGQGIALILQTAVDEDVLKTGGPALAWLLFLMLLAVASVVSPVSIFGGRFATLERQLQLAQSAIVILVGLAMVGAVVWLVLRLGLRHARLSSALAVLLLLGAFTVHSAWNVSYYPSQAEPLVPAATSREVRVLAADISALARLSGETAMRITAEPELRYPLAWYLRQYRNLTFQRLSAIPAARVVMVDAARDLQVQAFLTEFSGRRYRMQDAWTPNMGDGASVWNWLANRVPLAAPAGRDIMVYFRP